MSVLPSPNVGSDALEVLTLLEPTAAAMLHDDRLVHADGLAVLDTEHGAMCPVTRQFAAAAAAALVRRRVQLGREFGLPSSSVLFHRRHTREVRRLLAPCSTEEANLLVASWLSRMPEELSTELLVEDGGSLVASTEPTERAPTCARDHRSLLRPLLVVAGVYAQAWDEAWARDVFGPTLR